MPSPEPFLIFTRKLNELGLRYMVSGSIHHDTGFKADIYLTGEDPLHAWGRAHCRTADLEGDAVVFAPPEYVIIRKLQFYREGRSQKHLRDIGGMLRGLGETWDQSMLRGMIRDHGLDPEWEAALLSAD
jgi:hypothetical protein